MAKIYGLFGSMTGKLADTVMSVRNGEQIARKYQPVVFNPSTTAQVAQRAKLKLLSQLSAVMAPYIAISKNGNVSSRNLFTKVNFPLTSYANNEANITLAGVQLTKSAVGLGAVTAQRDSENPALTNVSLNGVFMHIDKVVYISFEKNQNNKLRAYDSIVVNEQGTASNWPALLSTPAGAAVIYAYGIRINSENGRTVFGDLQAPTAETVAKIVATSSLSESDVTFTETRGVELAPRTQNRDEDVVDTKKKK